DGAAGAPHRPYDVATNGADFYAFSGHKVLGPMGSGVLWGKKDVLENMPPFLYGGSMISRVSKERSEWAEVPQKFEAGTPNAADAVGLGTAIDYIEKIGFAAIEKHEAVLHKTAGDLLSDIPGVTLYGHARKNRVPTFSFNVQGAHTHDVGSILDEEGIAVRSGHHCAQVLMQRLGIAGATRASFYFYNTEKEAHRLADAVKKAKGVFA
ncbi:MAG TPA: aminotransferase class V-fold PLP-dependent enzyme, partial [Candidatus Norongarragalinales archaeon]|nr:aminotransferase class V-fold PLP-dependent enzyme [Candidatus Norongarragalinales archaeon]